MKRLWWRRFWSGQRPIKTPIPVLWEGRALEPGAVHFAAVRHIASVPDVLSACHGGSMAIFDPEKITPRFTRTNTHILCPDSPRALWPMAAQAGANGAFDLLVFVLRAQRHHHAGQIHRLLQLAITTPSRPWLVLMVGAQAPFDGRMMALRVWGKPLSPVGSVA